MLNLKVHISVLSTSTRLLHFCFSSLNTLYFHFLLNVYYFYLSLIIIVPLLVTICNIFLLFTDILITQYYTR